VTRAALVGVLAALAAAGHGVGTSGASFAAHDGIPSTMSTATDWVAPALTLTTPADGSAQSSTSVTLSGAAGNATGDSTTVTVNLYSGTTAIGAPVTTRSVTRTAGTWSTTVTSLAAGTYTAQATQSDSAGNTATSASHTFTIDTTAPTRTSISAVNGGATAGRLEAGDSLVFTYSEAMAPSSILAGWNGSQTAVKVRFYNGTTDSVTVLDSAGAANVKLDTAPSSSAGGVSLGTGTDYVSGTVTFAATMTPSADGRSITVVLGTPDLSNRVRTTQSPAANMTWTPKAGITDLAGNALANTNAYTETDTDRDF
jgi:hypothetical protein